MLSDCENQTCLFFSAFYHSVLIGLGQWLSMIPSHDISEEDDLLASIRSLSSL